MNDPQGEGITFESSLLELERIVRDLEDGRLGLEEGLGRYEQGVGLIKYCYAQLRQAEQRILQVTAGDGEDHAILQPFKHEATAVSRSDGRKPRLSPRDPG